MDVQHGLELFVGGLLNDIVPGEAGVVHDDVDRAEAVEHRGDELLRELRLGDVSRQVLRAGQGGGGFARGHFIQVIDEDGSASGGEAGGNCVPDTPRGARYQRRLSFQRE